MIILTSKKYYNKLERKKGSDWNITGLYDNFNDSTLTDQMISDPISPVAGDISMSF